MTMAVPVAMRHVVNDWRAGGRPRQDGIAWPRRRWIAAFPEHNDHLAGLPERLARADVRASCVDAAHGGVATKRAFLTAMTWGYGNVGYGPWRTARILRTTPNAVELLADVAAVLVADGAIAAYARLGSSRRLKWFGPAFGTKYLYFCQQRESARPALILDRLIADWLDKSGGLRLNPVPWSTATYRRYIEHMWTWAEALGVAPDVLEERIFVDEARKRRNQWA